MIIVILNGSISETGTFKVKYNISESPATLAIIMIVSKQALRTFLPRFLHPPSEK